MITDDAPPKSVLPDVFSGSNVKSVLPYGTQKGTRKCHCRLLDGYNLGVLVQEGVCVYIIEGVFDDPIKGGRQINRSGRLLVIDGGK
ncbi:MAG: hypothetical protein ACKO67_06305 [Bacteroidota bacterium]